VNLSPDQYSCIDYILTSASCDVKSFKVLDPDINFSDHVPLTANIGTTYMCSDCKSNSNRPRSRPSEQLQ